MPPHMPVQFLRKLSNGVLQLCGNRVQLEDANGVVLSGSNSLPIHDAPIRDTTIAHRAAIAVADKVIDIVNTDLTTADNGAGTGSLAAGTTYYVTAIPGNRYGVCKVATTINTQVTGINAGHSIRLSFAAKAGAEWYDIFLSTDTAPKWVGRITEAQRAAGNYEITAVGVVAAGSGSPAGSFDIDVVGTGIQTLSSILQNSTAYIVSGITKVSCAGKSKIHIMVKVALTDIRVVPAVNIIPFLENALSGDFFAGNLETVNILQGLGMPLFQDFYVNVDGASGAIILVDYLIGQGTAVSIWVETL